MHLKAKQRDRNT